MMTFSKELRKIDTPAAYEAMHSYGFTQPTQFIPDNFLSERFDSEIILASDLHQQTGAYKERGAFNWFLQNVVDTNVKEVVTSSAGNHAAAVARAARYFHRKATIYMPVNTPVQKIDNVATIGGDLVNIVLAGNTYDQSAETAMSYLKSRDKDKVKFVHPFDDPDVISGQGTLGEEILHRHPDVDVIISPFGGGGLFSGLIHATKNRTPNSLHYVAVEPRGAASLTNNLLFEDRPLAEIDTFVDGAAVKQVGKIALHTIRTLRTDNYHVIKPTRDEIRDAVTYFWQNDLNTDNTLNSDAIHLRPELAGALSIATLAYPGLCNMIRGRKAIFLLTGGNLSKERYESEIAHPNPKSAFAR